jgi:spermidine/putrescine transport system permease protein
MAMKWLGFPYWILLGLLVVAPMALMVIYSLQDSSDQNVFSILFTFENYARFFNEPLFIGLLFESLWLAFVATLVTLILGFPLAYLIARSGKRWQVMLILLVTAPMWINMLLRTRALQQVFEMIAPDWLGTNTAIIIGMSYVFLPFMVLPIYAVLNKMDDNLFDSASDLGANGLQRMIRVILPLSLPGILSGILLVFLPAATTLVIPRYLGEGRFLLGNLIENAMIQQGNYGYGSAIAIVMTVLIMTFWLLIRRVERRRGGNNLEQT